MKKTALSAALLVGALGLAGCMGAPEEAGAAPTVAEVKSPPVETGAPVIDIPAAKAAAIESGRPEAAWDKNCVAWEMPEADTKGQAWANEMGAAWLDSLDAGCPDAITFPDYYVDSWEPGAPGELTLIVDSAINKIEFSGESGNLNRVAFDFICELYRDKPELSKVVAATDDGKWKETVTRKDLEDREARGFMDLASNADCRL